MITNEIDDVVLPVDFVTFVRVSRASARRVKWGGSSPGWLLGWAVRLGRATTLKERLVLKLNGFRWLAHDPLLRGGGCWGRRDSVSCGYCGMSFKSEAADAWKCACCGRRCT